MEGPADPSDYGRLCRRCVTLYEAFLEELQLFLDKSEGSPPKDVPPDPANPSLGPDDLSARWMLRALNAALDEMQRHLHRSEGAATQDASPDLVELPAMLRTLETSARGWWRAARHEKGVALTLSGV